MANTMRPNIGTERGDDWVPSESFGWRLKLLRADLGLTAHEAADLCHISRDTWGSWERGKFPQRMHDVVVQIADATGVDRGWLMWGARSRCFSTFAEAGALPAPCLPLGLDLTDGAAAFRDEFDGRLFTSA